MKWAYSIQQKFKAAALLAIVFVLVLISNLSGRYQMHKLSDSFSSVYEDRLVVESYIYKLSEHLYQKKMMLDNCSAYSQADINQQIDVHNQEINQLLHSFEKTMLTEEEADCLLDFKATIAVLEDLEHEHLSLLAADAQHDLSTPLFNEYFALASADLRQLSQIQINEGKALNELSQQIVQSSSILTSFEMIVLICIAVILQVLVFASRSTISRNWQNSNLN